MKHVLFEFGAIFKNLHYGSIHCGLDQILTSEHRKQKISCKHQFSRQKKQFYSGCLVKRCYRPDVLKQKMALFKNCTKTHCFETVTGQSIPLQNIPYQYIPMDTIAHTNIAPSIKICHRGLKINL